MNTNRPKSNYVRLPVIQSPKSDSADPPWQGDPDWPIEVSTAVAKRIGWLKSNLLDIVVRYLNRKHVEPKCDEELQLDRLLNLDEEYLKTLESWDDKVSWLPHVFRVWTEAEIEALLTEQQRQEFREVGISSLLSRIDYPWETQWVLKLSQLNHGLVMSPWEGEPRWSAELTAEVAERLFRLKSQTLELVAKLVLSGKSKTANSEEEAQHELELTLALDEGFLQSQQASYPDQVKQFRSLRERATAEIEQLLTESQRREFREVGTSSLLSRMEYPWKTELGLRLSKSPVPYFDSNGQLIVIPKPNEQAPSVGPISAWLGEPEWPAELRAAVAKRLVLLKSQLLDIVVQLVAHVLQHGEQEQASHRPAKSEQEGQQQLEKLLNLDEGYLQTLESSDPKAAWLPRTFAAWTESLIDELLTEEQRQEFRKVGISSLLSRTEFSWDTELVRRLNRSNQGENGADYRDLFCPRPFEYVEIGAGGKTHLCCAVMLPTVAGDKRNGSFMDVWNSETAQAIRQSILDGTFTHCIEHLCPELHNRTLPKRDQVTNPFHKDIIDNHRTVLSRGPTRITMNYDKSCNLACPMCRTERITAKGAEKQTIEEIQQWATREHLKDTREMIISTAGDAFGSATYHNFLRNFDASPYPDLRLRLVTNGLHLTPKNWERICHENVDSMHISIDAATPATYRVNRGANFNRLLENLHFAGQLRFSGQLKSLSLNYTVQENNFAEMPAFVSLAQSIHADLVLFIQLANGGTFTQEEYQRRAVHQPSHPRYGELLEVLKNPLLRIPMVQLQLLETLS